MLVEYESHFYIINFILTCEYNELVEYIAYLLKVGKDKYVFK